MDKLMGMTGLDEVQVIHKALSLYHYALVETGLGGKIILQKPDEDDKEIMIPS
jgi:hypothetical protein